MRSLNIKEKTREEQELENMSTFNSKKIEQLKVPVDCRTFIVKRNQAALKQTDKKTKPKPKFLTKGNKK